MKNKKFWYTLIIMYITVIAVLTILDLINLLDVNEILTILLIIIILIKFISVIPMGTHSATNMNAREMSAKDHDKNKLMRWKSFLVLLIPICIALLVLTKW